MPLEARDRSFILDGKKIVLLSGALHYFRVVPDYWKDRLLRLKACGLNCVETYVPWNKHEEIHGHFNFTGILDIGRFIKLAHDVGLYVILRPGPYICSEWDFGGLPSWLLHDSNMQVRSSYQPFLDAVDHYFARLLPEVTDLQYSKGGPIIAVQIENEYGSYGDDPVYKNFLKEILTNYGINELLFTSDNGMGIQRGDIPGVLITANFQEKEHGFLMFEYMKNVKQPDMPMMVMEFWTGWFDHWGEKHHVWPLQEYETVLGWILDNGGSVNFYMFHGGTNFGFMNGANEEFVTGSGGEPYSPDVTSYDYDAPVAENGDLMPKWFKTRQMLQERFPDQVPSNLPEVPPPVPSEEYGRVAVSDYMKFSDMLKLITPVPSKYVIPMEMLDINNGGGQGYGFILYRARIGPSGIISITGKVKDRAIILVDGKEKAVVDWLESDTVVNLDLNDGEHDLDILVENLGRVNYVDYQSPLFNAQRKGLVENVYVDDKLVTDWQIYPIELKENYIVNLQTQDTWSQDRPQSGPAMCRFHLQVQGPPKDTFISMTGWSKGVVFVNGFNLGRYWSIGPQDTLYIPAPLLKQGTNQVLVFELHEAAKEVTFNMRPQLGETVIHKTLIPSWARLAIFSLRNVLRLGNWVWPVLRIFVK